MKFNLNEGISKKLAVIGLLYLAEGLPYGFLFITLSVYFRSKGIELKDIGLISLIGLPWSFKALWSPIVDKFFQRWHWIVVTQLIIALCLIYFANIEIKDLAYYVWLILIIIAFAGATQDIAIDAYSIDILEPQEQGIANGVRTAFYRIAVVLSGGILIAFSNYIEWKNSFYFISFLFFLILLIILISKEFKKPKILSAELERKSNIFLYWYVPIKELLKRKSAVPVVFFIVLFKFGDAMMGQMVYTFWYDNGFSRKEIGLISGTLGMVLTITGALIGGYLTSRWDVGKSLWRLGIFQSISNLGYAAASYLGAARIYVYSASFFESFTSGLGTAAFLAFLMRLCKKQFSATQYAVLSSFFTIGSRLAGALGGITAQSYGYTSFFIITFLASLPAFGLLPSVFKNLSSISSNN
jgi:PAT family beta-lactamase induction signal transducer AmpG